MVTDWSRVMGDALVQRTLSKPMYDLETIRFMVDTESCMKCSCGYMGDKVCPAIDILNKGQECNTDLDEDFTLSDETLAKMNGYLDLVEYHIIKEGCIAREYLTAKGN